MNDRPTQKISIIKMNLSILKYVFKFCPMYFIFAIISIISSVIIAINEVDVISIAVDAVAISSDLNKFWNALIIHVIIIAICYTYNGIYNRYIVQRCKMIYNKKMQTFLFRKVKHIDMASYDDPTFYDKFSRALNDSLWRGISVFNSFVDFAKSICVSIALGAYVFITNYLLLFIIIFSALISVIVVSKGNKVMYKVYRDCANDRRYQHYVKRTFYQQKFAGEMKTTPISNLLIERFDKVTNNIQKTYIKEEKKLLLLNIIGNINDLIIEQGLTYIYLTYLLMHGLSIATFTSTANAAFKFASNFKNIVRIFATLREHSYYIGDFLWIVNYEPEVEVNEGEIIDEDFKEISINNISFSYPLNSKNSINNLSMSFKRGEHIAIVGDNGSGKTTLTKLLLKFYNPNSGVICFNGKDIKNINEQSLRKQYSIVYQDFQIYALSIAENVLMRKIESKEDEKIVEQALDKVGLLEKVKSFKDGIYTKVTKEFDPEGATFSGGETQRLVIARVFASNADIYILDEPTSALDPLSEEKINKLIMQSAFNKTMIIIAHRLSTVVDADKIYLIRDGKIIEEGIHQDLIAKHGRYYEMFMTQTEFYIKDSEKENLWLKK